MEPLWKEFGWPCAGKGRSKWQLDHATYCLLKAGSMALLRWSHVSCSVSVTRPFPKNLNKTFRILTSDVVHWHYRWYKTLCQYIPNHKKAYYSFLPTIPLFVRYFVLVQHIISYHSHAMSSKTKVPDNLLTDVQSVKMLRDDHIIQFIWELK